MRYATCIAFAGAAFLVGLSGCQFLQPVPAGTDAAAVTTAVGEPIAFRLEGAPLDADGPQRAGELILADAVRQALQQDASVQAALSRVRIAEAEALQTRFLPNPVVSVSFRFQGGGSPIIDASLAEELLALLTQPSRTHAADARLRAASAEAVSAVLDALREVKERYTAIQGIEALAPVLQERARLNRQLLDLAQARLRAGEGTKLDVTTLEAQQAELAIEIAEKQREGRSERLALARLLGTPSAEATWMLSPWPEPPRLTPSERAWVATALTHRPEIAAKRWELAARGIEVRLSGWAFLEGADFGVTSERDVTWSVGPSLSVPVPLFDWGQARRDKAAAERTEASHELTAVQRQVVQETRQAHSDYVQSLATLDRVRTELIPLQESRRSQAEAAYKAGQTDITSLVLADQDLQGAHTKFIELQGRVFEVLIRLERAAGGPAHALPATTQVAPVPISAPTP